LCYITCYDALPIITLSIVASSHILHKTSSSTSGQLAFGISYYEFGGLYACESEPKATSNPSIGRKLLIYMN
jgi:hypothetical protein